MARAPHLAAFAFALALVLGAAGYGIARGLTSDTSTSAHRPPVVCAADSSSRFQEAQKQAPFAVYCPTFVPDGFVLARFSFGQDDKWPPGVTPPPGVGNLHADFVNSATGTKIQFFQGLIGDPFPQLRLSPPATRDEASYGGELQATLTPSYGSAQYGVVPAVVMSGSPAAAGTLSGALWTLTRCGQSR